MSAPRVLVVGSINLDMRVQVEVLPEPGATVLGTGLATGPGGKGANQAVAAARVGGAVSFVGSVGSDDAGTSLRAALEADGVSTTGLRVTPGPSGLAIIEVDAAGQNRIVVIPGANGAVTPESLDEKVVAGADVVLLQLEVPLATVRRAAAMGRAAGALVVLNAAPATPLSAEDLADVDVLVVNEVEATAMLAGLGMANGDAAPAHEIDGSMAAASLIGLVPAVVVTLGANGAAWAARGAAGWPVRHSSLRAGTQPAFLVTTVDTTGAGDTFVGALGVRLWAGEDMPSAIRYASAAAALATTRVGAQEAAPYAPEVDDMLAG
ncbi:MAG TPA: ribokinase, partial [Trueperaceae bacterium]|nr:ribokinase [Trueperaceae bacterium]